ncbi:unnamed protein product [Fraxinus pennsylvanica]|uniref:Uncharacterized protein n=1 Tax=Fraxinus pennsylvanica TaxID=56036 RepID=A0AAD1YMD2_9LAMI|nr:unnamed protein product [Fraxinus pennsylvanica]
MIDFIFVDPGSNELENKHVDFTSGSLYFLKFSFRIVRLVKGGGWKMDCFHCSCIEAFLPPTFSRLAGDARFTDYSFGGCSKFLCSLGKRQLGWRCNIPCHWLLSAARAHQSVSGFRNSFTQSHGISNTVGIILLLVYPIWDLVVPFEPLVGIILLLLSAY